MLYTKKGRPDVDLPFYPNLPLNYSKTINFRAIATPRYRSQGYDRNTRKR